MNGGAHEGGHPPAEDLSRLADLVELAATYFLRGPTREIERLLGTADWADGLAALGLIARPAVGSRAPADEHAREFASLLRIPDRVRALSPQEGARPERRGAAARCQQLYRLAGYDPAPFAHIPPDQIGHQLRFLAALLRRTADCLARGDAAAAAKVRGWIDGFTAEHGAWWDAFAGEVRRRARTPQLRTMASLAGGLRRFVREGALG